MNDKIVFQLTEINKHLSDLVMLLKSKSFLNSPLFAAIVGALVGAISALLFEKYFNYKEKTKNAKKQLFKWIAENIQNWSPQRLLSEANRNTWPDSDPSAPQDLGDKMITLMRQEVKYWTFPSRKVKSLFQKYESVLKNFSDNNKEAIRGLLDEASKIFKEIEDLAFKETGESRWTL